MNTPTTISQPNPADVSRPRFKFPGNTHLDDFVMHNGLANAVNTRGARTANVPPREKEQHEKQELTRFIELPDYPRQSREQGVGKSPGFRMPWRRTWESIIPKGLRGTMGPIRVWRELPTRPEQAGWSAAYLKYFEQRSRHVWPGGSSQPGRVIEHPESAPLTAIAARFKL